MATERTYIMIKPDGVQRNLVGEIIKRFEQRGYHLVALKLTQVRCIKLFGFYRQNYSNPIFCRFQAKRTIVARALP
jgi:nucleoside-diphosphate kinase